MHVLPISVIFSQVLSEWFGTYGPKNECVEWVNRYQTILTIPMSYSHACLSYISKRVYKHGRNMSMNPKVSVFTGMHTSVKISLWIWLEPINPFFYLFP